MCEVFLRRSQEKKFPHCYCLGRLGVQKINKSMLGKPQTPKIYLKYGRHDWHQETSPQAYPSWNDRSNTQPGPGERRTTKERRKNKKGRKKRNKLTSSEQERDATAGGYESWTAITGSMAQRSKKTIKLPLTWTTDKNIQQQGDEINDKQTANMLVPRKTTKTSMEHRKSEIMPKSCKCD